MVPLGGWNSLDPAKRCLFWKGRMTVSCSSLITSSRPAISLQDTWGKNRALWKQSFCLGKCYYKKSVKICLDTWLSQWHGLRITTVTFIVCGSTRWDAMFISYSVSLTPSTPILFISCSAWKDRTNMSIALTGEHLNKQKPETWALSV